LQISDIINMRDKCYFAVTVLTVEKLVLLELEKLVLLSTRRKHRIDNEQNYGRH